RDGVPKLVERCTYPLTAARCVRTVVTDLAVIDIDADGFLLREVAPGVSVDDVRRFTAAPLRVAADAREMPFGCSAAPPRASDRPRPGWRRATSARALKSLCSRPLANAAMSASRTGPANGSGARASAEACITRSTSFNPAASAKPTSSKLRVRSRSEYPWSA